MTPIKHGILLFSMCGLGLYPMPSLAQPTNKAADPSPSQAHDSNTDDLVYSFPTNPIETAKRDLAHKQVRTAGWGMPDWTAPRNGHAIIWEPYGLTCTSLPQSSFKYVYEKSDAIGDDAGKGYAAQKRFMRLYNAFVYRSTKMPKKWGCKLDLGVN